jgi:hypothetical protein
MFFRLMPSWMLDLFMILADWTVSETMAREPIPYSVTTEGTWGDW